MSALIGGCNTYSKTRLPANAPAFAWSAEGCHVNCSDGKSYIDYVSALGAVILGHNYPSVKEAVKAQLDNGISFSLPTHLEHQLADRLAELTGFEAVRFGKNGNDVTNAAVRIARAHTGRGVCLMQSNGYHGHADPFMTRPPKNGGVLYPEQTRFYQPHDVVSLNNELMKGDVACVIMEAVVSGDPQLPPEHWFTFVRNLCDHYGALLILDEMVTGFRSGHPGAIRTWNIKPDMACYGKAIANGLPFSALVGRRELLEHINTDVFYSTTFAGDNVAIASALATLDVLEEENVCDVLAQRGKLLMAEYDRLAFKHGLNGQTFLYGYPQRPMLYFKDAPRKTAFLEALVRHGFLVQGYFNLMLMHDDLVIGRTIRAFDDCLGEIADKIPEAA